jgi:hypothetical protein
MGAAVVSDPHPDSVGGGPVLGIAIAVVALLILALA